MTFKGTIIKIIWSLPPSLRDFLRNFKRSHLGNKRKPPNQQFIQIIDGSSFHGGLTDRFKGIISSYLFCKINGIEFKILHTSPFELSLFLDTNQCNWQLNANNQYTLNIFENKLIYLIGDPSIKRLTKLKSNKQIHCYSNRDITDKLNMFYNTDYTWGNLFLELFSPNQNLREEIDNCQIILGANYNSAVYRFQNLLGDFKEYNDVFELSNNLKIQLIQECKKSVIDLKNKIGPENLLVTSDSKTFLETLHGIDGIIAFPRNVVHIDNSDGCSKATYQKSFLDFFLLSESKAIYSIGTPFMYNSDFPRYASKIHGIPFKRIEIHLNTQLI